MNILKEILRVLIFIFIIIFYLSSIPGLIIGLIHLLLVIYDHRKFGMSRLLIRLLASSKKFKYMKKYSTKEELR